jgi:hypothetical protein
MFWYGALAEGGLAWLEQSALPLEVLDQEGTHARRRSTLLGHLLGQDLRWRLNPTAAPQCLSPVYMFNMSKSGSHRLKKCWLPHQPFQPNNTHEPLAGYLVARGCALAELSLACAHARLWQAVISSIQSRQLLSQVPPAPASAPAQSRL